MVLGQAADCHAYNEVFAIKGWVAFLPLLQGCIDFLNSGGPDTDLAHVVANKSPKGVDRFTVLSNVDRVRD